MSGKKPATKKPAARKTPASRKATTKRKPQKMHPFKLNKKEWNKIMVMEYLCNIIASSPKGVVSALKRMEEEYGDSPDYSLVRNWIYKSSLADDEEGRLISRMYERAKEDQADYLQEELLDIVDDARNDYMETLDDEGNVIGYRMNGENVQRSRLRADVRKWVAAKLKPRKYGDSTTIKGDEEAPLHVKQETNLSPDAVYRLLVEGKKDAG